jgi:hypothetical protein
MAFDCLSLEDRDLRSLPQSDRRTQFEAVVENDHTLIFPGRRLAANGLEAWAQAVRAGYEGMVAKDNASPPIPGLEYKPNRATGETLPGLSVIRDVSHLRDAVKAFDSLEEAKEQESPPSEAPAPASADTPGTPPGTPPATPTNQR